MLSRHIRFLGLAAVLCATFGVSGCRSTGDVWKYEAADRLATPVDMIKRQINADPYMITVYERVGKQGSSATIYFEGDGDLTYTNHKETNQNPTPTNPVGLHLATRDLSDNVIYIARPCQYSGQSDKGLKQLCDRDAWQNGRYSIDTLLVMNTVLEKLKDRYGFTAFNLVGFDGGAAVAVLLAAKRKDILTLRTAGGILDTKQYEADHGRKPLPGSLNPKDFARDIANIPQYHFLAGLDIDVTPDVYMSFRAAMGDSSCIRSDTVEEIDHLQGWANRWPSLLALPVDCNASQE